MSLLSHMVAGATGYAVSELSKSHPLTDFVNNKLNKVDNKKDIRTIINEYAKSHGIYTSNDDFAYELHNIARTYESYNYPY